MSMVLRSTGAALIAAALFASAVPAQAAQFEGNGVTLTNAAESSVRFEGSSCGAVGAESPDGQVVTVSFSNVTASSGSNAACQVYLSVTGSSAYAQMRGGVITNGDRASLSLNATRRSYTSTTDDMLTSSINVGGSRRISISVSAMTSGDSQAFVDSLDVSAR